jgi:hypothetical protein
MVLRETVIRLCADDSRQAFKSPILNTKMVGGPGFEPGASRSRTVRAAKLRQPPTTRPAPPRLAMNSVILPVGQAVHLRAP